MPGNATVPILFDRTLEIQLPEDFIPEEHFSNENIEKIEYFKPMYEPESVVDYLIITSSLLWDTFDTSFKDWKIITDDKIDTITIVNVSDIIADNDTWVNGQYGDGTNISNGNPWVENGTEISDELFNDTQCKIRNFIRKYIYKYNTTYVLLAGNKDIVPVRMMCTYSHSGPGGSWYNNTNHAVDMYYACLNGNFNNNSNSLWGQNNFSAEVDWVTVPEWDYIDYYYDVLIGRVLVNTVVETNLWINKTKAYVESNDIDYLNNGIMACKDVSNYIDDYLWVVSGDEFSDDVTFLNDYTITQTQWSNLHNYCNGVYPEYNGFSILFHAGHGGTLWTPYQPSNLNNANHPNFLYTEGCDEGDFGESTSSRTEQYMQDDGSMFAGISNSAYGWFTASEWYLEEMSSLMFNDTRGANELCFAKAHFDSRGNVGWKLHSVCPMIFKETNFFGDPALEFHFYEYISPNQPVVFSNPEPANNSMNNQINLSWNIIVENPEGEPFNWTIECNNQSTRMLSDVNGTKTLNLTNLSYSIFYIVYVNATDGENNTNMFYLFKTRHELYMPYDINEDSHIDYLDVSALVSHYDETGVPDWIPEDIVGDGLINYLDVSSLVSHYGETY